DKSVPCLTVLRHLPRPAGQLISLLAIKPIRRGRHTQRYRQYSSVFPVLFAGSSSVSAPLPRPPAIRLSSGWQSTSFRKQTEPHPFPRNPGSPSILLPRLVPVPSGQVRL